MLRLIPLTTGFVLDLILGDPSRWPHPVVAIGKTISRLEKPLRRIFPATPRGELAGGGVLVCVVCLVSFGLPFLLLDTAARAHPWAKTGLECVVCYQALATKCLRDAAMAVYRALAAGDLSAARVAVAMIVGRDTANLDADGVARAAVETVAENASDGVVAPMLYFAAGGAPLALLYKAVNTMDSMLGYKNEQYIHFGRVAAKLDDLFNFIPARVTAILMLPAAAVCGLDWRGAFRVWRRDRARHASPNAGNPEAACAGALGIRLGGDSRYGGVQVSKPTLGDASRRLEAVDILRANRLLYGCAGLCFILCCAGVVLAAAISEGTP